MRGAGGAGGAGVREVREVQVAQGAQALHTSIRWMTVSKPLLRNSLSADGSSARGVAGVGVGSGVGRRRAAGSRACESSRWRLRGRRWLVARGCGVKCSTHLCDLPFQEERVG